MQFINDGSEDGTNQHHSTQRASGSDSAALDAYSRTVIAVSEAVMPTVIGITGQERSRALGAGTGVIISPEGLALTNSHVVNGRTVLSARTSEGDRLDVEVIGDDPSTDLALLQVDAHVLPFARLATDHDPIPGQLAVALGSPFGLHSTVSAGIVSATGRSLRGQDGRLIDDVLQHTAPINPGNSGGPLLDSHGHIIGINTAIIALAQGVGFAISAKTVQWVVSELSSHGQVRRTTLGIAAAVVRIPEWIQVQQDILNTAGVAVVRVEPNSLAASAGLHVDDVIVSISDRIIESIDDIHKLLARVQPNSTIVLGILRDGELRRFELQVVPQ